MTSTSAAKDALLPWREPSEPGAAGQAEKPEIPTLGNRSRLASSKVVEFAVFALPALWLGALIFRYGVDCPWGDQWDGTFPLFAKMQAGTIGFGDFYAFHSEHRILFPSLIAFFLAKATHWNIRAELLVIWLLACGCAFNVWRISTLNIQVDRRIRLVLLCAAGLLLLTPLQWENLLWGFQIGFFLPLFCTTALPWVAYTFRRPFNILGALVLCLVSTFSIASGFSSWFIAGGLLLLANGKGKSSAQMLGWIVWIGATLTSVATYFHGFRQPGWHPSESEVLRHPLLALQFILTYLGFPFSTSFLEHRILVATSVGGLLVTLFLSVVAYLWRTRANRSLIVRSGPWLALASIAFINCFLTMLGRLGFGLSAAMQSRYVSFAILLPVALIFLVAQIFEHWRGQPSWQSLLRRWAFFASISCAALLACLFCTATIRVLRFWPVMQHERLTGKSVLFVNKVVDESGALRRYLHPSSDLKDWAATLDQLGYIKPRPLQSNRISEIIRPSSGQSFGVLEKLQFAPDGKLIVGGWAVLHLKERVADSVLLTSQDEAGDPRIFARLDVKELRKDVAEKLGDDVYRDSGWSKSLAREQIPPGTQSVSAWALDAEEGCVYLIGTGSF